MSNRYKNLKEKKEINLWPYSVVSKAGDWKKGLDIAVDEVKERLEPSQEVKETVKDVKELVVNNLEEFSGRGRVGIAAGIVCFSHKVENEEISKREVVRKTGISRSTLGKYLEIIKEMWED